MLNAPSAPFRFPHDILRFLYWVFFKPITLSRYLQTIDPNLPREPWLWRLWQRRKEKGHPEFVPIIQLASFHIYVTPYLALLLAFLLQMAGFELNLFAVFGIAIGVLFGITIGVLSCIGLGVSFGMLLGVFFGIEAGASFGVAYGVGYGVSVGVIYGMTTERVSFGVLLGVFFGTAVGVFVGGMVGMVEDISVGVAEGILVGVAGCVAFMFGYFRIPLYIFQFPFSFLQSRWFPREGLRYSPVFWDELIWFPLPGLDRLLVEISKRNREEGLEAIAYVASSFRQGWAARDAILELTASDVRNASTLPAIGGISEILAWLPENARGDYKSFLLGVEQVSQHARAALESETLYNRQEQLRNGLLLIRRMNQGFALDSKWKFAQQMIPALQVWEHAFETRLNEVNTHEAIPNVYVAGSPLVKDSRAFKGRRDLFAMLNNELVNPSGQRPAMLLFGARRMGKTSTLKQLPVQLGPQIVPVSIDLQKASTVESASGLLYLLAREVVKSAAEERRLPLPELTKAQLENDPYLVFQEWLEDVEKALGDYWVLLALDEYESLGEMKDLGRIDDRIFQLLRGIIQGHPRFTVLMSGSHTLEDLPPYWSNFFINTKMLKVGPLLREDAEELIARPIENFPLTYDEDALDLLISETGCHPNWLQLACRETVEKLNNEKRFHAKLEDVEYALAKVPQVLAGDFKDLWKGADSNDLMRSVLKFVANSKNGFVSDGELQKQFTRQESDLQDTLDYLTRRDILVDEDGRYRFNAALLRRWVAKQR